MADPLPYNYGFSGFLKRKSMYNNLIYFIVALLLFTSSATAGGEANPPLILTIGLTTFLLFLFSILCRLVLRPKADRGMDVERNGFFIGLSFFALLCYASDLRFHLLLFSFHEKFLLITDILGLAIFLLFAIILWFNTAPYGEERKKYVQSQLAANLPIVLPWGIFSLSQNLLGLIPSPSFQTFLQSGIGQFLSTLIFLLILLIIIPPLIPRVWRCTPLPQNELYREVETFCTKLNFSATYLYWPLMQGKALTAGVVGFLPGLRYILFTPSIIKYMDLEQLKAILAHEIAHIKYAHILKYIFLVISFSLSLGFLTEPLVYAILSSKPLIIFTLKDIISPNLLFSLVSSLPVLIVVVVFFRFVFGFFIRNFERQADLFTIEPMHGAMPLISAFENISRLTGTEKAKSCWHHFGLGERIAALQKGGQDPSYISKHNRKVRLSLWAYALTITAIVVYGTTLSSQNPQKEWRDIYAETAIKYYAKKEPQDATWQILLGDLYIRKGHIDKGIAVYSESAEKFPDNAQVYNNLAYYMLTLPDPEERQPQQALILAKKAISLSREPQILDTLATAYWAVGELEQAVLLEQEAMTLDPTFSEYYRSRIQFFVDANYQEVQNF